MKNASLMSIFAFPLLAVANTQCETDNAGVHATKAYAKNFSNSRTPYSCAGLLSFKQYRDGSYFETEEWMRIYLECALQYPRYAEKGLLGKIAGMLASERSQVAFKLLKESKFKFSPLFRSAIQSETTEGMAELVYPILLEQQANGVNVLSDIVESPEQWSMREAYYEINKTRPNCELLVEFMNKHGKSWDAGRVKELCEVKRAIAPDLVPR